MRLGSRDLLVLLKVFTKVINLAKVGGLGGEA
jgi:hypothetical protein